jgi:DNA-binding transcriptional MerR regulator
MESLERRNERRLYSEDDVKEILERALNLQGREFSREHLVAMAEELGISAEQLEVAEQRWTEERATQAERAAFIAERQREAVRALAVYAAVALFIYLAFLSRLFILPVLAMVAVIPMFFAGLNLIVEVSQAFFHTEGDRFDQEYEKWMTKRRKRELRRARRGRELPS